MKISRDVENLLAALRGLPPNRSRSIERDTVPIKDLLPDLLSRHKVDGTTPEQTIQENWEEVVGSTNARFSRLLGIQHGKKAIVGVSNPVVRQEMFFHRKIIVERLQKLHGCKQIASIMLVSG